MKTLNPPAFPCADRHEGTTLTRTGARGMDLRDYFAARAMHAELLSAGSHKGPAKALADAADPAGQTVAERIASLSYELADAMLVERAKDRGRA